MEREQLRFGNVVFMQDLDADEPMKILEQDGKDALLEYLKQWDNGETYDRDIKPPWGKSDRLIIYGDYVISYNSGLPTVGLTAVYHPDPTTDDDWREKLFLEYWETLDLQESYDLIYETTAGLDVIWEMLKDTAQSKIEAMHQKKMKG